MPQRIHESLQGAAREVGIDVSMQERERLVAYLALLQQWSRRINLVGTRNLEDLVIRHVVDSLAVVPHVPTDAATLVDVGSGAGLPGLVIALVRRDISVTALEPVRKKHAFLMTARRQLALDNLRPVADRMEAHCAAEDFARYDVAVSRATFALPEWLDRARALVRNGGLILGMEGAKQSILPPGAIRHSYRLSDRTRAVIEQRVTES